ncbi:MAG: IMP dehydrogenase [Mariprofundales bacterium]|nr:IMP dehydrogenase [Mariprofundales bacterium]
MTKLTSIPEALTFDDVLLVPQASSVLPKQVKLGSNFTRNISLKIPVIAAAMDTVTEASTAICLAQEGGIGVIHKNMTASAQAQEVRRVKRFESGVVQDPMTVTTDLTIEKLIELSQQTSFSGFPVLGPDGKVCGIVTNRDIRFESNMTKSVAAIMTPRERLISALPGTSTEDCKALFHKYRIEKLPIIDAFGRLQGMMTVRDLEKSSANPNAVRDEHGRLLVAAAIGVGDGELARFEQLLNQGVDAIVVDTAHGHSSGVLGQIREIKRQYGDRIEIVGGNIATPEAVRDLIDAGADAVKVGIGPGSICTTRIVAGVGVPQLTAVMECAKAAAGSGVPVIADGGIKFSGDFAKAMAAGAGCCMFGSMFAGTDEAPGEKILFQGRTFKSYRGMGSISAMEKGSKDRYFQGDVDEAMKLVPEGIEGRVPYRGALPEVIHQLIGGLRASMGYIGAASIAEMHEKAKFVRITGAGLRESHVHDVTITKEAPNYRQEH